MDAVHLHLLLNHAPILGGALALAILAWGLLRRSREIARLALGLLFLFGALTYPVSLSGEQAEERIEGAPWVVEDLVQEHEERAEAALAAMLVAGALALGALVLSRGGRPLQPIASGMVLAAGCLAIALLVRTGLAGGVIRHDELRGAQAPAGETEHGAR